MTFAIGIYANIRDLTKGLNEVEKRNLKFAFAQTLNKISFDAVGRLRDEAARRFDRPVNYTVKGWGRKKVVDKRNPAFDVFAMPNQAKYLELEVHGGTRRPGDYGTGETSFLIPARATPLNKHGNIPTGYTKKLKQRAERNVGLGVFFGPQDLNGKQVQGWWQRPKRGTSAGRGFGNLAFPKALVLLGDRASYRPRFDLQGIVQEVVSTRSRSAFREAMAEALATDRGY